VSKIGENLDVTFTKLIEVFFNVNIEEKCLIKLFIIKSLFGNLMPLKPKLAELKLNRLIISNEFIQPLFS
ncbi:MAG: hypothetical protein ACI9HU_001629, partial [Colwellia sp.]